MAISLRLSRLDKSAYQKPQNPFPWLPTLFALIGIVLLGFGLNNKLTVPEHGMHAVVRGELPLGLTESNINYALEEADLHLNDEVTLLVTDQKLSSDAAQQQAKEADANLILAVEPETGMIHVPEGSQYMLAEKSDTNPDISSDDYGVESKLSRISDDDLEQVALNNIQAGQGPLAISAMGQFIEHQQDLNRVTINIWLWLSPLALIGSGLLFLHWASKNRQHQHAFYRYATARGKLTTMVLNHDALQATTSDAQENLNSARNFADYDASLTDALRAQAELETIMRNRRAYRGALVKLAGFEKDVDKLAKTYNQQLIDSHVMANDEIHAYEVYSQNIASETSPKPKWAKATVVGTAVLLVLVQFPLQSATSKLADSGTSHLTIAEDDRGLSAYSTDFMGDTDLVKSFFKYKQVDETDPAKAAASLANRLTTDPGHQKNDSVALTVAVLQLEKYLPQTQEINSTSEYKQLSVSATDYMKALASIKADIPESLRNVQSGGTKDNNVVQIYLADQNGTFYPLTFLTWYGVGEIDRKIISNRWIDNGNNWLLRNDTESFSIDHLTALTDGGVSKTFKASARNQLSSWYLLMANVVFLAVLHLLVKTTKTLVRKAKNRNSYTQPLRATRALLEDLLLQLDEIRLESLVSDPLRKDKLALSTFEARLADSWHHLRLLEAAPSYLQDSDRLHQEIARMNQEVKDLHSSSKNVTI